MVEGTHALAAESAAQDIEAFVREHFQVPADDRYFTRQVNLWEDGYVDSVGVVEMLGFLEERFGVKVPDEVLFSPDFTYIDGIARFVVALRQEALAAEAHQTGEPLRD